MLKKEIITIILIFFILSNVLGQKLQHVKGLNTIDVSGYYTSQGLGQRCGYTMFLSNVITLSILYDYEKGDVGYTEFNRNGLMLQPGLTILKPFKNDFITAYIPIIGGFETLNSKELLLKKNFFMYHAGIGISNEYNINSIFAILLHFDQMLAGKSEVGQKYFTLGIGLRLKVTNLNKKRTVLSY